MKRSVDEGGEQHRHPKKSWLCLLVGYYPVKDGDDRDNILVLWRWLINMDGIGDMETIFTEAKFTKAGWSWIQLEISGSNKVPTKDAQSKTLTKMTLFPLSFCSTELNKRPITWPMFPPSLAWSASHSLPLFLPKPVASLLVPAVTSVPITSHLLHGHHHHFVRDRWRHHLASPCQGQSQQLSRSCKAAVIYDGCHIFPIVCIEPNSALEALLTT